MRILHVLEAVEGGTALHVKTLACSQRESGDDVAVAVPRARAWGLSDHTFLADIGQAAVETELIPIHKFPLHPLNIRAAGELGRFIRRWKPEVVHTHSTTAGAIARPVARALGARVVHTPNGVHFADTSLSVAWVLGYALERVLSPITDRVVAVSKSEAEVLRRTYRESKISVVRNGIPVPDVTPPPFPSRPRIVTVNRLVNQKNPELAVRIMAMVRAQRPDVEALMVGDGPLAGKVESLIAGIDPGIRLVRNGMDGIEAMEQATAVLLTSRWEGAPYVPLEAMALSRPVVATDVVGSRDVVDHGKTGFLFSASRPEQGAANLIDVTSSTELASRLGSAGRRLLVEEYTIEKMVKALAEVYRSPDVG